MLSKIDIAKDCEIAEEALKQIYFKANSVGVTIDTQPMIDIIRNVYAQVCSIIDSKKDNEVTEE